jgi:hypothetical protein
MVRVTDCSHFCGAHTTTRRGQVRLSPPIPRWPRAAVTETQRCRAKMRGSYSKRVLSSARRSKLLPEVACRAQNNVVLIVPHKSVGVGRYSIVQIRLAMPLRVIMPAIGMDGGAIARRSRQLHKKGSLLPDYVVGAIANRKLAGPGAAPMLVVPRSVEVVADHTASGKRRMLARIRPSTIAEGYNFPVRGARRIVGNIAEKTVIDIRWIDVYKANDLSLPVQSTIPHRGLVNMSGLQGPSCLAIARDGLTDLLNPADIVETRDIRKKAGRRKAKSDTRHAARELPIVDNPSMCSAKSRQRARDGVWIGIRKKYST